MRQFDETEALAVPRIQSDALYSFADCTGEELVSRSLMGARAVIGKIDQHGKKKAVLRIEPGMVDALHGLAQVATAFNLSFHSSAFMGSQFSATQLSLTVTRFINWELRLRINRMPKAGLYGRQLGPTSKSQPSIAANGMAVSGEF